jgi:hypothetical protein
VNQRKYIPAVALAAIALTLTACSSGSPPTTYTPPPPPTTYTPPPPPTTYTPPPPPTTTESAQPVTSWCDYTVNGIGDGVSMQVYSSTADCTAAANAFEAQVGGRYSVSPADNSVTEGWTLCNGTVQDSSGTSYQVYVYASPSTGIQGAVASNDAVCIQLGWS